MNRMEAVVHQQPEDLRLPNFHRELMVKPARMLLLTVALTSTVGSIYFLSKAAWSVSSVSSPCH
jgi:hypothetical protein